MVYLLDLADVARVSGLNVIESPGWETRGHGGMGTPLGIVCHHTGTPDSLPGDYPSMAVVRDGRPDLEGPLSQLGIGRSGTVYVIAAGLAWHAGDGSWPGLSGNWDCIGIEAESSGSGTDWTAAQRDAYPRICAALCRAYSIDPAHHVIAHREWAPTRKVDPTGINMPDLRATVAQILAGQHEHGEGGGELLPPPEDEDDMPFSMLVVIPRTTRKEDGTLDTDDNGRPLNATPVVVPPPDKSEGVGPHFGEVWFSVYGMGNLPITVWAERSNGDSVPRQVFPGAWLKVSDPRTRSDTASRIPVGTHGLTVAHDSDSPVCVLIEVGKAAA